jgi:signal transduction histidine kinase
MYAELLEDHMAADDAVGQERLRVVVSESQRLSRLITNILTFARGERGHLTVHPAAGCVDEIVRDVLAQFTPSFVESQTTITFDAGAAGRVNVDADALSQMLGNLLSNVEKYAPGRPVAITTRLEGAEAIITVHDQGPGIPVAAREKVFDLFVRLGGHAHEGVAGTGIGLCIARTLARLHGGDLRVQPTERGACLRLTFKAEAAT